MNDQSHPSEQQPGADQSEIATHVKKGSTWLRLLFMIVMAIVYSVAEVVVGAVVVLQFFWVLFTGQRNPRLLGFGQSLATYLYEIVKYLTFNTERRPFPFDADWPHGQPDD